MKKLMALFLIALIVILIFLNNQQKSMMVLSITDCIGMEKNSYDDLLEVDMKKRNISYVRSFSDATLRTTDLITKIESNKKKKIDNHDQSIKNLLIKADITILSVGYNDIMPLLMIDENQNDTYHYMNSYLRDVEKLFKIIRLYSKEEIYFLSLYNPLFQLKEEYIKYMNEQIKILCESYHIEFIDYYKELTREMVAKNHLNQEGQKIIYGKLSKKIEKYLLNE